MTGRPTRMELGVRALLNPRPRFRPQLQSMPPSPRTTPETCRPSRCSSDRDHGTSLKTKIIQDERGGAQRGAGRGLVQHPPMSLA